ncbi:MAG: response regulator transcription factor [Saprospiraceae bacterium]|nr:response regulator transcription factor [Saprospiraceae bacterium]
MHNLLIVDDHQIIIDGLKALFAGKEEAFVIFEALDGKSALQLISNQPIDFVLLDINLPDLNGFEVCKSIKKNFPKIKVIALTMHGESAYITQMVKAGVDAYILKNAGKDEILKAITTVRNGERYFSQEVALNMVTGSSATRKKTSGLIQKLTRREKEILRLVIEEMTTDEIAAQLFISPTTVISHRKSLLRKLNAKNTAGLVKAAYEYRLLDD